MELSCFVLFFFCYSHLPIIQKSAHLCIDIPILFLQYCCSTNMTIAHPQPSDYYNNTTHTVESNNDKMIMANNFPPKENIPEDATEATSRSSFEGEEEEDSFDSSKGTLPMPPPKIDNDSSRSSSSSSPFVLEVAPRNGRLGSKDPLFQGVCLYDGAMTEAQVEKYNGDYGTRSTATSSSSAAGAMLATSSTSSSMEGRSSWTSSVFRLFSASNDSDP